MLIRKVLASAMIYTNPRIGENGLYVFTIMSRDDFYAACAITSFGEFWATIEEDREASFGEFWATVEEEERGTS